MVISALAGVCGLLRVVVGFKPRSRASAPNEVGRWPNTGDCGRVTHSELRTERGWMQGSKLFVQTQMCGRRLRTDLNECIEIIEQASSAFAAA